MASSILSRCMVEEYSVAVAVAQMEGGSEV